MSKCTKRLGLISLCGFPLLTAGCDASNITFSLIGFVLELLGLVT